MILPDWKDNELVEELCSVESGLTPWETEFVDSITEQVEDMGRTLSSKQRRVCAKILARLKIIEADDLQEDDDD